MYRSTRGVPLNYFLDAAGPRTKICSFTPKICSSLPSAAEVNAERKGPRPGGGGAVPHRASLRGGKEKLKTKPPPPSLRGGTLVFGPPPPPNRGAPPFFCLFPLPESLAVFPKIFFRRPNWGGAP